MKIQPILRPGLAALLGLCLVLALLIGLAGCGQCVPAAATQSLGVGRALASVTVSGAAGAATGTADTDEMVRGQVMAIYLDYTADISTTTDVVIGAEHAPSDTILSLSNYYTDTWVYPRRTVQDNTNTNVTFDGTNEIYEPFWVDDYVRVAVSESSTSTLKAYIYWQR